MKQYKTLTEGVVIRKIGRAKKVYEDKTMENYVGMNFQEWARLDEAIKLLQATPVIKVFYNDGGVLDCSSINIFGNEVVADEVYTIKDYEIDRIEAGEV